MSATALEAHVQAESGSPVIELVGDVDSRAEGALDAAYAEVETAEAVLLDFARVTYMNSGGIGLLVTLLVRANRAKQSLLAFGLTEHYREIFELTRLDEAIGIYQSEADAVAATAT